MFPIDSTPRSHPRRFTPLHLAGAAIATDSAAKGKEWEFYWTYYVVFFPAIRVFSTSSSLRLRGDFSLRLQAGDMGKKAQSDSLYRCNTYFTFGFKMPFSMATTVTTTGSSGTLALLFWKFTWCTIQDWTVVAWTEFRRRHTIRYIEITGDSYDVSGVALTHVTGSCFIPVFFTLSAVIVLNFHYLKCINIADVSGVDHLCIHIVGSHYSDVFWEVFIFYVGRCPMLDFLFLWSVFNIYDVAVFGSVAGHTTLLPLYLVYPAFRKLVKCSSSCECHCTGIIVLFSIASW